MIKKLFLSQAEKVKIGFWLLSQDKLPGLFFYLLILFLPTQLGKHFWPKFSFVFGLRLDYLSPTIYLTDVLVLLILLFSLRKIKNELYKINRKYLILYFIFLISLGLGLVNAQSPLAGAYGILKVIEFSFFAFYVYISFKLLNKKIIFSFLSASIVFESLLSILQYFNNSSLGGFFYLLGERTYSAQTPGIANATINGELFLRPYATFSHPNVLAGFLVFSVLFLIMLNLKVKKNKIIFITFIFAVISLALSLSRSAIALSLFYVFCCFTFLIFEKFKNGKSKTGFVLAGLFFIPIICLVILFKDSEIIQRFLSLNLTDESVLQRKELINQSISMFIKSPILGTGINNFYNNLEFTNSAQTLLTQPVHNIFFLVLSETGLIGFVFFLYLLLRSLLAVFKKTNMERIFFICIFFGIIFLGFFDHYFLTIQQGQLLLALFFGAAFSYKKT